jgi:TetR/AcrR family transcriptional regulator
MTSSVTRTTKDPAHGLGASRILDAACDLFAEGGYAAISLNSIADRAQVSKSNIFHHYASKEALYEAALRETVRKRFEQMEALATTKGSYATRLRRIVVSEMGRMCDKERHIRLMLRETLDDDPKHSSHCDQGRLFVQEIFNRKFAFISDLLARGQRAGDFRKGFDPAVVAMQIMGTSMFFIQCRVMLRQNKRFRYADSPEQFAGRACDALLRGLAKAPSAKPTGRSPNGARHPNRRAEP